VSKHKDINWVIVEEPEAGLHPQAVSAVLLGVMELLVRGYKVILSTHSSHILDFVWGWKMLQS
jgi:predicted ATP-dependent endonuclease of OLD family